MATCPNNHPLKMELVEYKTGEEYPEDEYHVIFCNQCNELLSMRIYAWHCSECNYDVCFKCRAPDYDEVEPNIHVLWLYPTPQGRTFCVDDDLDSPISIADHIDFMAFTLRHSVHSSDYHRARHTSKTEYFQFLQRGRFPRKAALISKDKISQYYSSSKNK